MMTRKLVPADASTLRAIAVAAWPGIRDSLGLPTYARGNVKAWGGIVVAGIVRRLPATEEDMRQIGIGRVHLARALEDAGLVIEWHDGEPNMIRGWACTESGTRLCDVAPWRPEAALVAQADAFFRNWIGR